MRRLFSLTILAAAAIGCQSAQQPCCRPANNCSPCGQSMQGMQGMQGMTGPVIESYGAPTLQATPGMIVPGTMVPGTLTPSPQTYTPSMP